MLIDAKFVESDLTLGDYFMYIYISEQNERLVIPSMLSGLTWIRCGHCSSNCEGQHQSLYDPKFSYTYKNIMFDSKEYTRDESFSHIVFGCDEVHQGDFEDGVQCVVGLGQGPLSLVSQVGKKWPFEAHSKIKFGSDLTLNKQNKEYKVEFQPSPPNICYHLNHEAISVNDEKIEIVNKEHDMAVDIQTSLTSLPSNIYNEFIAKVKSYFGNVRSIKHPEHDTCFLKNQVNNLRSPKVVLHFSDSSGSHGDFPMNPSTMFEESTVGLMCSTIIRNVEISILGSRTQVDVEMNNHEIRFKEFSSFWFWHKPFLSCNVNKVSNLANSVSDGCDYFLATRYVRLILTKKSMRITLVQEIQLTTSLDQEGIKKALQRVLERIP
ncbi:probable aspartic protease At2g35615 [Tripterygium wilfordii]|uniref:probable aspartic protease At2g35615 n=1 Tax=Tripterygium wilfordii TaxID=458696 RepID=UPI0018F84AE3|nr:probable aspartic protease At2g35615 [Tripterygium wilfordii]